MSITLPDGQEREVRDTVYTFSPRLGVETHGPCPGPWYPPVFYF